MPAKESLADRWLRAIKNNPIIAAVIVAAGIIGSTASFYSALPASWVKYIAIILHLDLDQRPTNGWAFVGYLDQNDLNSFATPVKIEMVTASPATRQFPFRIGDVIRALSDMPQVIVDHRDHGTANVLIEPPRLRNEIIPASDYTGLKFQKGQEYEIADVKVAAYPMQDAAMWVRLVPH